MCDHFLKKIAKRHGHDKLSLSKEALSCLFDYNWPGNVRELENVMEYSVIHASGLEITIDNLPSEVKENHGFEQNSLKDSTYSKGRLNRDAVLFSLEKAGGNKSKAAKILGVGRATLYRFLKNNSIEL